MHDVLGKDNVICCSLIVHIRSSAKEIDPVCVDMAAIILKPNQRASDTFDNLTTRRGEADISVPPFHKIGPQILAVYVDQVYDINK